MGCECLHKNYQYAKNNNKKIEKSLFTCLASLRVARALQVARMMYCWVMWSSMGWRVWRGSRVSSTQRWWLAEQKRSHRQLTDFTTSATTDAHNPLCV